ncbi:MAG: porin [Burkholderiaceae bacterium]
MKLISSAVLVALGALSAAASAQSSVELYGRVDGGLQYVRPSNIDGVGQDATFGLVSGHTNGSRFGMKGSENLGGSLKAIFVLEAGYGVDDGKSTQGGRLFGREAFVGLRGTAGTMAVGRFGGLTSGAGTFNMMKFDPFSTAWDQAGMKAFSFVNKRLDNSIVYVTPTMAGVTASAMHSFSTNGQEEANNALNETYSGIGANYKIGKLLMGLHYEQLGVKEATALPDQKSIQFGAYYDFPVARAYFNYEKSKDAAVKGVKGSAADADTYMVGLKADLPGGAGSLLASYQYRDGDAFAIKSKQYEADLQIFSLGYLYPLSKRTQLYASYVLSMGDKSWDKDAGRAGNEFAAATVDQRADYNSQVATFGLRTRF